MPELLWMAGKAFVIALILTPIIRDIFRSFDIVDRPAKRKMHAHPLPRVGGISVAIAYAVALLWAPASGPLSASGLAAWQLIPGAAVVFLTGLLDDFFSLKPWWKISGLVAGASAVFWSGLRIERVAGQPLPLWLAYAATVFWLLLTSNALNLIDGLDGLCAGMGALSALTLFTAALLQHNLPLAYATFPLAGALVGFLCYNLNPATVFLGDSGALLVGFLLGCYGMFWTQKASTLLSILVPLMALSIPLLDLALAVLRRLLRHQPIFSADRNHIHHRLLERGLSPRKAVWVLYLVAASVAAFALVASSAHAGRYQGLVVALLCAAAGLGIHKLRYAEFDIAGQLLGRGFQRSMEARLRNEEVGAALGRAGDEDSWWNALVEGAGKLGLVSVQWEGAQAIRQERLAAETELEWSFRIPLSETDAVEVRGLTSEAMAACDLVGLAQIVSRTFPGRVRELPPVAKHVAAAAS